MDNHKVCAGMLLVIVLIVSDLCVGSGCLMDESQALLRFRGRLYDREGYLSSWLNGTDCCKWRGVECHGETGHVSKVDIHGFNLSALGGRIDSSLFALQHLTHLDLSSNAFYGIQLPHQLGLLRQLKYLNMSNAGFRGTVPPQLGNLSGLRYLDLSFSCLQSLYGYDFDILKLSSHSLDWLTRLSSLYYLSLGGMNLSVAGKSWVNVVGNLSKLEYLGLSSCSLTGSIPDSLLNLSSLILVIMAFMDEYLLGSLDLSYNNITGRIPYSIGKMSSLQYLNLSLNTLIGEIPSSIVDISTLFHLDLHSNELQGTIPSSLGFLVNLTYLDVGYNRLNGTIPSSLSNLFALHYLDLSHNRLQGSIPHSFGKLSSLTVLRLSSNELSGSLPLSIGQLSSLSILDIFLYGNHMSGSITGMQLQNLTKLDALGLSNSGLRVINISSTWIPPFQLRRLSLGSCKIGGPISTWISTQISLQKLGLSGNNLVGDIPPWLWDFPSMTYLNLSQNNLRQISFSPSTGNIRILDLSKNELKGNILLRSSFNCSMLTLLNVENNHMDGNIPASLANCSNLRVLNIANNRLKGGIPEEFGKLKKLQSLHMENNKLGGTLTPSLRKWSELEALVLRNNAFAGSIPGWISDLSNLQVLLLRSNYFRGRIPSEISQMKNLHVLDISSNSISGSIPESILNLPAMTKLQEKDCALGDDYNIDGYVFDIYRDGLELHMKGRDMQYPYVLCNRNSIDLSNNQLTGQIPPGIGALKGLRELNLSRNHLSGYIPKSLGQLAQLDSLDLSANNLSRKIPWELQNLSFMGSLNLSNNNLSGKIPRGGHMLTYEEPSFVGNPDGSGFVICGGFLWSDFTTCLQHVVEEMVF
eukprot:Gb_22857 [translate_table: standard]